MNLIKRMNTVSVICMSMFALVVLAGCTQAPTTTSDIDGGIPADTDPIKIGVITPLAGGAAVYGEDASRAYNYIVDQVNANGGIDGRQVELIYENGACGGKEATNAAQKLINIDGVEVILGGVCSSETIPAGNIAQQNGVTIVSALSSSPEISSIGEYMFRYWNDADAGVAVARYLEAQGANNIALITENSDYAISYAQAVRDNFAGEVLAEEKVQVEEKDLTIVAKKIGELADSVDYVMFIAANESLNKGMLLALENEELLATMKDKLLGSEILLADSTLVELGSALDGVRTATLSNELEGSFTETLAGLKDGGYEIKSSDVFIMLLADSADLVLDAIDEVGYDADAIKDYIAGFTEENPRTSLIGGFWFDAEGDGQGLQFVVKEARDGELVEVE